MGRGYIQSVGGVCTVVGDELWFFYSGAQGGDKDRDPEGGMYANRSMGIAKLRRDGFASMQDNGRGDTLLTRPLRFSGQYLFANFDCPAGELRAEVLDENGHVIEGLGLEDSITLRGDRTKGMLTWRSRRSLAELAGRSVRFRFHLKNGRLFSFWVSRSTGVRAGDISQREDRALPACLMSEPSMPQAGLPHSRSGVAFASLCKSHV